MPTLRSTPIEPAGATISHDRTFPARPPGSAHWRRRKEYVLCQTAAALRWFGGSCRGLSRGSSSRGSSSRGSSSRGSSSRGSSSRGSSSTGILTYHHVAGQVSSDPYLLNVTPARFRAQIKGLLDSGYRACSLREVVARHQNNLPTSDHSFVVVFDDGHHSVYENAWPVLRDLGVPATVFLATAYLDRDAPLPFDACLTGPSRCGDTRRPLTTLECQEMLGSGLIDLGSHTHAHEDYRGRPDQFSDDLTCSLRLLRDRFGLEQVTFSFPYGRFDAEMQRILARHGLLCALTAECQCVTLNDTGVSADPFGWGRFGATELDTARTLAAKLDGWYTWLQRHWRKVRG